MSAGDNTGKTKAGLDSGASTDHDRVSGAYFIQKGPRLWFRTGSTTCPVADRPMPSSDGFTLEYIELRRVQTSPLVSNEYWQLGIRSTQGSDEPCDCLGARCAGGGARRRLH